MTKKQRDEVVELLRCAADLLLSGPERWQSLALYRAAAELDVAHGGYVFKMAFAAADSPSISVPRGIPFSLALGFVTLEAAARVEEGWTP